MANADVENQQPSHSEETPLLAEQRDDAQQQEAGYRRSGFRRWLSYTLKALLVILIIALIALFIKGWVDAGGDVEVGFIRYYVY